MRIQHHMHSNHEYSLLNLIHGRALMEQKSFLEFAVVMLLGIGAEVSKDFAVDLFNTSKIGKTDTDNGLLIYVLRLGFFITAKAEYIRKMSAQGLTKKYVYCLTLDSFC